MTTEMQAEFDTVAVWTADVALDLGPDHHLAAGCRGSGSPGSLRWLVSELALTATDLMLDCGAGVGGPAAYAEAEAGVRPVLSEPEHGACRAAARLFGLPTVQAGSDLPFADATFDVVWSLGVLCTVGDQPHFLDELHRVLKAGGRLGLLVFVAQRALSDAPVGNTFPTDPGLRGLLADAGFAVRTSASLGDFAATPEHWQERADAVEAELARRHGADAAWEVAERQSQLIGRLLADGELAGVLLVAEAVGP